MGVEYLEFKVHCLVVIQDTVFCIVAYRTGSTGKLAHSELETANANVNDGHGLEKKGDDFNKEKATIIFD